MGGPSTGARDGVYNPIFTAVRDRRRRRILDILIGRSSVVSEEELTVELATTERESSLLDVTPGEARDVRIDLRSVQLPLLEDSGLVTWDTGAATVTTTDHPILRDPRFRRIVEMEADGLDDVLAGLSHEHRRIVLTVLKDEQTALSRIALAREILRRKARETIRREIGETVRREIEDTEPDPGAVDDFDTLLNHCYLPELADAGLIEYASETGLAEYTGHPALEEVLAIIHEPDERLVDKFDEFLGGLGVASREMSEETGEQFDLPHFWGDPYHG